jgi:DNA-binding CsgD family transcriptional regulator
MALVSFSRSLSRTSWDCPLGQRELEALRLAARGMTPKEIARRMDVKFTTIRTHLHRVRQKLAVSTTTQAVVACIDAGWIDPVSEGPKLLGFADTRLTAPQRVYLDAFDLHLRAGNDDPALEEAKRRTNAALAALGKRPGSVASRSWIDALLSDMRRLASGKWHLD